MTLPSDFGDWRRWLPHRPPFLFIEEVREIERGAGIVVRGSFAADHPIFAGHFPPPDGAVVPGVLQVEAISQAACILGLYTMDNPERRVLLSSLEQTRFRDMLRPPAPFTCEVELVRRRGDFWQFKGSLTGEGASKPACTTQLRAVSYAREESA